MICMAYMLGFTREQTISKTTTGDRQVDLEYGFHDLFVYCDLIQSQYVGDALVPLLRIVPVEGEVGQRVSKSFVRPQYLPVSRKQFETIEVNIKRDTGESVIGKKALQTGVNVAQDVLGGDNIKTAISKQAKQAIVRLQEGKQKHLHSRRNRKPFLIKNRMAFVHHESHECTKSELDLFTIPATQTSIHKEQWIEYHPLSNITDTGPIEFNVSGTREEYLDLARTQLYVKAKITKANGTALDADTQVGPVNLFLHSLFSQVDVCLNERLTSASTNTYPYRAMLESLLNYGEEAKTSQLSMAMFYKDTAGKMNVVNPLAADDEANLGLKARYEFTKESHTVDMMGPIHSDIFFQDRLMLNGVNLRIKLNRAKNVFCLVSSAAGANFKVVITEAILFVRRVKVASSIILGHAAGLKHSSAKYPIRRIDCKVLSIPRGFSSFNPDNIFLGQIPKRIVLGLVDTEAYNGSYRTNPFNFNHHNFTEVGVYVDREQIPRKPLFLKVDAAGGQNVIAGYQSLFSDIGNLSQDMSNQINRSDYGSGYTLFAFDLTPDHCPGDEFELIKQGNLRLELHFSEALANTVNLIVYAEFQNVTEVDANRNVLYDYTN
ncbi:unnamed protein product [Porites lobata]|uniref:Major capsid protein n=1 Tax=Porites lobata TaxID=104759 RepID=A0ABN8R0V7_9CNID|nr:unnamed protein product [Porites lobata]